MIEKLINLDRRWIFLIIGLAVLIPILSPFVLPEKAISEDVKVLYEKIESLEAGSKVLISFDFDPASKPELYPMAQALLRHCFRKNLKVVSITLWATGVGLGAKCLNDIASESKKKMLIDFVYLGWKPGSENVIISIGQNLYATFKKDFYGNDIAGTKVLEGINKLRDFKYVITLTAGSPGCVEWIQYGSDIHRFELGAGCTGVIIPELFPFLRSGQLKGLLPGMKGAAEYEALSDSEGRGRQAMGSISVAHFTMIFLILACNLLYIFSRMK